METPQAATAGVAGVTKARSAAGGESEHCQAPSAKLCQASCVSRLSP